MILRLKDVLKRIGLSRATIYRWIDADLFPKPVRLGPNSIGWREEDLTTWERSRINEPRPKKNESSGQFIEPVSP